MEENRDAESLGRRSSDRALWVKINKINEDVVILKSQNVSKRLALIEKTVAIATGGVLIIVGLLSFLARYLISTGGVK